MYPTPQGLFLTFEQFDKLKDVTKVLPDLIPDLNTTLPCYMSHQNVEELYIVVNVIPTEPISTRSITAHYILKEYNVLETICELRDKVIIIEPWWRFADSVLSVCF